MKQYIQLLEDILENGEGKSDRTGTGTTSVFGRQLRFRLDNGMIPVTTTKKLHWKAVVHELLWFISGSTNTKYLRENGVKIWDKWADDKGDLGPIYGAQWRRWVGYPRIADNPINQEFQVHDQLSSVIRSIKENPDSRRHIVSAWNVGQLELMAIPPCHLLFQFYVNNGKLSCQLYQRSADVFIGVPFNIASYALLTHMVAHVTGLKAHEFIHTFGDVHIYNNHRDQVAEQIKRTPYGGPKVSLNPNINSIYEFGYDDIKLEDYQSHPSIKGEVSV